MSRSNPSTGTERPTNPAVKFFEWDSESKQFKHYDKEKKENTLIPLPFSFLVLDTLATIKGWDNISNSGIYSNEIKNIKTDILTIRTKNGVEATGFYNDIKGKVVGAKYCQSIYIAYSENKVWQIANIQMKGSALSSWIEFCSPDKKSGLKRPNLNTGAVKVSSSVESKIGKIVFNKPVFTYIESVPEEVQEKSRVLDIELQEYLQKYFSYTAPKETENTKASAVISNLEHWAANKIEETTSAIVPNDFEDEGSLPF